MICKNCGAELSDCDLVCHSCGNKQEQAVPQSIKCVECGRYYDDSLDSCPFCKEQDPISNNCEAAGNNCEIGEETTGEDRQNNFQFLNFSGQIAKKRQTALLLAAAILTPFLCAGFFGVYNLISSLTSYSAKKFTNTEITEIYDEMDYSAISATLEHYCKSIEGTYLYDADGDGRKELFAVTYNDIYIEKPTVFAFDTIDIGTMASATQYGAAGNAEIVAFDNNLALKWGYYSIGNTSFQCEKWTNSGWKKITGTEDLFDMNNLNEEQEKKLNELNERIKDDSECHIGKMSYNHILSKYYNATNSIDIIQGYREHLNHWWGDNYKYIQEDIDGDGEDEYAFITNNFAKKWAENLTLTGTDGFLMEEYLADIDEMGVTCIYVDTDKSGCVFHTFFTEKAIGDNVSLVWQDGELVLNVTDNKNDFAVPFFCSEIELVRDSNQSANKVFKTVGERYLHFLRKYKYSDVLTKYVDICDAPGDEMICVCSINGINTVNVYALYCGRMVRVYEQSPNNSYAIYISREKGKTSLLYYEQSAMKKRTNIGRTETSMYYRYWLCRFDRNYAAIKGPDGDLFLKSSNTPTKSDNAFFEKLNLYIDSAIVCVDPYELTGYSHMSGAETDNSQTNDYLYISNCSLNKKGTVHVEINSWLNFRKGPSIYYDRILSDSGDPESFVKQMNGSSVTVIDTENTEDKENPIWVKIQIKYSGESLIGYSSQRYIDISNIKTVKVGETFKIKAETNVEDLVWTSNDIGVLFVNNKTGEIKGIKPGLSLVRVESVSGLYDSCLVLVTK